VPSIGLRRPCISSNLGRLHVLMVDDLGCEGRQATLSAMVHGERPAACLQCCQCKLHVPERVSLGTLGTDAESHRQSSTEREVRAAPGRRQPRGTRLGECFRTIWSKSGSPRVQPLQLIGQANVSLEIADELRETTGIRSRGDDTTELFTGWFCPAGGLGF